MAPDHFVGQGKKTSVRALPALALRFCAENFIPLVAADGLITGLAGLSAFKTAGINIVPTPKEASEQGDLGAGSGDGRLAFPSAFCREVRKVECRRGDHAFFRWNLRLGK
jgi:hypothetical protein